MPIPLSYSKARYFYNTNGPSMNAKTGWIEGCPTQYLLAGDWHDFPVRFRWQSGLWLELFDKHADYVVSEIQRAKLSGKFILYLSCPVSSAGGGHSRTNIEIATFAAHNLIKKIGSRFWILNPGLYQLQSREGFNLLKTHAHILGLEKGLGKEIDLIALQKESPVTGGDYMRFWSRVLVEDGDNNLGGRFDAYYFVGPSDTHGFFTNHGATTVTDGIENYFARKLATNQEFREYFQNDSVEEKFFKYYSLKAGAHFSLGSHDEYAIWETLNRIRLTDRGITAQIPGYFDGRQIGFGLAESKTAQGYSLPE